ncbi:MAG: ABC transporter ATP-binding protein [Deltaproteobacteria bacterium]|nr:ABC transporter ATP-binding protein [Deltaproteobacteria bacterium]
MILSVAGVHFQYPSRPVLRGVSFELPEGQILGVLGVNGAGKSTLLKCLNKILRPEMGSVLLDGEDLLKMGGNEVARAMGYVPQKYGDERLTVYDTVLLGRKPYIRWAAAESDYQIVERVLQVMRLEDYAMRPIHELSGGEMQKVIIVRALAQEPKVLLLDEPISSLDLKNQLEVMDLICRVVEDQGLSAILAIHDINLALRFADRLLFLKEGRVYALADRRAVTPRVIREVYGVEVILQEVQGYPVVIAVNGWKGREEENSDENVR